jgi:hypothetical protein
MATNAFLVLDGFGLVFLMYALANFWNEWRRYKHGSQRGVPLDAKLVGDRVVRIPPVYLYPKNAKSVILFPARYRQLNATPEHQRKSATTIEMRKRMAPNQSEVRASKSQ